MNGEARGEEGGSCGIAADGGASVSSASARRGAKHDMMLERKFMAEKCKQLLNRQQRVVALRTGYIGAGWGGMGVCGEGRRRGGREGETCVRAHVGVWTMEQSLIRGHRPPKGRALHGKALLRFKAAAGR